MPSKRFLWLATIPVRAGPLPAPECAREDRLSACTGCRVVVHGEQNVRIGLLGPLCGVARIGQGLLAPLPSVTVANRAGDQKAGRRPIG